MPSYPRRPLTFYLMTALIFLTIPAVCAGTELTEAQKQAKLYHNKGRELQKKGDLDAALSYYQKAVFLDPTNVAAHNDVGIIFEAMGWIEQAKEIYLKAIGIAPDYPNSYSNLALLYEGQKKYPEAVSCWTRRIMLGEPGDPWTEAARKRIEDITRIYSEAFKKIEAQ